MTPEEYINKRKELDEQLEKDKYKVAVEFAISNNPYPIGTVITDHIGSLKIEKIKVTNPRVFGDGTFPQCVYFGIELKKDGTPMKKQTNRGVWAENIQK